MTCGIYRLANLLVDRRYFGQSIVLNKRENCHFSMLKRGRHDNIHLQRAWKKYGEDAFEFTVMLECEPFELTMYEQWFVDAYPAKKLYNIRLECVDSCKGVYHSQETRQKQSEAMRGENNPNFGKTQSDEHKCRQSEAQRGRHHTVETRVRISVAQKGELGNNFGKHAPEATLVKMREAAKGNTRTLGYKHTEETKQKLSVANKGESSPSFGKHRTEESKRKMSLAAKERFSNPEARQKLSERTKLYWNEHPRKEKIN